MAAEWLTCAQAADYLGLSVGYLRRLCRERRITHYRPSQTQHGPIYFVRRDLDLFLTRGQVPASQPRPKGRRKQGRA